MSINKIPSALFVRNRKNFAAMMTKGALAVFTANEEMPRNGDQCYPFRQNSDFFYLTGIDREGAYLILYPDHPKPEMREILFIEPYSEMKAIWRGEMLDAKQAKEISGCENVMYADSFNDVLKELILSSSKIYLNLYEYARFETKVVTIQDRFVKEIKEQYPLHTFDRSAPILNKLRKIKSPEEIEIIKHACDITGKAFLHCMKTVKPGRYEYEMQAEMEYIFKMNNASGHAFHPIVAGGKNACCLHYSKNDSILNDNEFLLFDMGCEYMNYASDLSRTIPINGKFTPRQRECYEAVLRVKKEITKLYKVGGTIDKINQTTYQLMEKEMIKLGLFTEEDVKNQDPANPLYRKYLMHGMSHHVGLDVHDNLDKYEPFAPGMVLTCEPGLYIREEGIGIRLEDDLLITDGEPINLFGNLAIEPSVISSGT
ncbi:MAG: aminopeptidase P N-terminal domain-containing protein [Bacteroidales bacterium]|nr:aminopeptidase P N-terminal domain-containing protein [Bacteroidales bacterium]